ncbi:MAG: hypothetical protein K2N39_12390 [Lachnospiraceae bacterium]|nr:hypothetical protein [Lachnospiraceae bacterium]
MWKYIRQYLVTAVIAGLFMFGEVLMDLVQPGIMSRIVDDGVLGVTSGGTPDLHLVWMLGLQMIGLVLIGGLCGSLNNVPVCGICDIVRKEKTSCGVDRKAHVWYSV